MAPPGWAPPTAVPRPRMGAIIAVVVVVIVVVAFLGLYFAGAIPGLKPVSGSSSVGVTFSAARSSADSAASGYSSGSSYPNLTTVLGFGLAQSLSANVSQVANAQGACHTQLASGQSGTLTVPAGTGGASTGSLPFWEFIYSGSSGYLIVIVLNGGASVFATVATGGGCSVGVGFSSSPIPSTVIDSKAAVAATANGSSSGTTFLHDNPNANAIFLLTGGIGGSPYGGGALWLIAFSDCSFAAGSGGGTAAQYSAFVNATMGTVIASTSATSACTSPIPNPGGSSGGGPSPLGTVLALGSPTENVAGPTYWYNFSVQSASNVVWNEMELEIVDSSGSPVFGGSGWVATVESLSGMALASYDLQTFSWTSGGATSVAAGQVLAVHTSSPLAGSGDSLKLIAISTYTGSVVVAIP